MTKDEIRKENNKKWRAKWRKKRALQRLASSPICKKCGFDLDPLAVVEGKVLGFKPCSVCQAKEKLDRETQGS